jgi:hypothetical protein
LIEDPAEQAAIAEICRSGALGVPIRTIAAALNERGFTLSKSTVANILKRHGKG